MARSAEIKNVEIKEDYPNNKRVHITFFDGQKEWTFCITPEDYDYLRLP